MDREEPARDKNGRLLPGNTANPEGLNGHMEGYQPYGLRALKFIDIPREELIAMKTDTARFNKLPFIDTIIIENLIGMFEGDDKRGERKDLLDRIEGQPKAVIHQTIRGKVAHGITKEIADFIDELGRSKFGDAASASELVQDGAKGTDSTSG